MKDYYGAYIPLSNEEAMFEREMINKETISQIKKAMANKYQEKVMSSKEKHDNSNKQTANNKYMRTCTNINCPERTGGKCTAGDKRFDEKKFAYEELMKIAGFLERAGNIMIETENKNTIHFGMDKTGEALKLTADDIREYSGILADKKRT